MRKDVCKTAFLCRKGCTRLQLQGEKCEKTFAKHVFSDCKTPFSHCNCSLVFCKRLFSLQNTLFVGLFCSSDPCKRLSLQKRLFCKRLFSLQHSLFCKESLLQGSLTAKEPYKIEPFTAKEPYKRKVLTKGALYFREIHLCKESLLQESFSYCLQESLFLRWKRETEIVREVNKKSPTWCDSDLGVCASHLNACITYECVNHIWMYESHMNVCITSECTNHIWVCASQEPHMV